MLFFLTPNFQRLLENTSGFSWLYPKTATLMEYLIYILTVGLLATTAITFRILNTLAKEVARLKKQLQE
jgi:hypothetical protein